MVIIANMFENHVGCIHESSVSLYVHVVRISYHSFAGNLVSDGLELFGRFYATLFYSHEGGPQRDTSNEHVLYSYRLSQRFIGKHG